jgi:O-antigen/teichoic acid export membrane protein
MDAKFKKLLNNTLVYALGNMGSKLLTFALIPLYSFYLSKEDFGYYDIVVTTITLLVPLLNLQISDAIFRWLIDHKLDESKEQQQVIITNGLIVGLIALSIIIIAYLALLFIHRIPFQTPVFIFLAASIFYPILQQTIRGLGNNKLFAASGIIYSATLLIGTLIFVVTFEYKVIGLIASSSIALIVSSLFLTIKSKLTQYFQWTYFDRSKIKELLSYSWPLIPNTISWWLVNSANKYIILFYLGTEANGLYGLANRFPGLLVMVNSIFMLAWQESAIENNNDKAKSAYFSKVFKVLLWGQLTFASILALCSEFITSNIIAPEYYLAWKFMPILFFSVAFSTLSGFFGTFYLSYKATKSALFTSMIAAIINVTLCFIFIQQFNLIAVAFSTFFGYFALFIIRTVHTRKFVKLNYELKDILLISLIVLSSIYFSFVESNLTKLILIIIIVSIAILGNYKSIFGLIKNRKF